MNSEWIELPLKVAPDFFEECGFRSNEPLPNNAVPPGVFSVFHSLKASLRAAMPALPEHPVQRYAILYYSLHDARVFDGRLDMEVEYWGSIQEILCAVVRVE
jgi:hypothetical protein